MARPPQAVPSSASYHRSPEAHMNRIHLDAYTAAAAIVILAGIITVILALANPVR